MGQAHSKGETWEALRKTFDSLHYTSMSSSSSSEVIAPAQDAAAVMSSSGSSSPEPERKALRPNRPQKFVPPEPPGEGKPRQPLKRRQAAKPASKRPAPATKQKRVVANTFEVPVTVEFPMGNGAFGSFVAKSVRGLLSQLGARGYDIDAGVSMCTDRDNESTHFRMTKGSIIPKHANLKDCAYVLESPPPKPESPAAE